MKKQSIFVLFILALSLTACKYDNYKAPDCYLSGQFTYQGQPICFDGNADVLRAYQKGFGKEDNGQTIRVSDNGSFSQLFFEGDYYLSLNNQQYPYLFPDFPSRGAGLGYDSILMHISSNLTRDFEVVPYFVFNKITYVPMEPTSTKLSVTIDYAKNTDTRVASITNKVQRLCVFVSTTPYVNSASTLSKFSKPLKKVSGTFTIDVELSKYRDVTYFVNNYKDYLYFRVGMEITDVSDKYYIMSPIYKVENVPYVK